MSLSNEGNLDTDTERRTPCEDIQTYKKEHHVEDTETEIRVRMP